MSAIVIVTVGVTVRRRQLQLKGRSAASITIGFGRLIYWLFSVVPFAVVAAIVVVGIAIVVAGVPSGRCRICASFRVVVVVVVIIVALHRMLLASAANRNTEPVHSLSLLLMLLRLLILDGSFRALLSTSMITTIANENGPKERLHSQITVAVAVAVAVLLCLFRWFLLWCFTLGLARMRCCRWHFGRRLASTISFAVSFATTTATAAAFSSSCHDAVRSVE